MARSGRRDVAVEGFGELHDGHFAQIAFVAFQGELGTAFDDRGVVTRKVVFAEQLSDFDLDQLEQLGVVDHVDFVQVHDDVGHTDLAREQDVLAGLRHRAVGGRYHQNGAVHLGRAGDHVLDVVGVAGAVDVGVMAIGGLVLDVRGVDGDAACFLFGRRINLVVGTRFAAELARQHTEVMAAVKVVLP